VLLLNHNPNCTLTTKNLLVSLRPMCHLSTEFCDSYLNNFCAILLTNIKWSLYQLCKTVHSASAVYLHQVENFTVSMSDGRAFCYLVHHYCSSVLPRRLIRDRTCLSCGVSRPSLDEPWSGDGESLSAADVDELLASEKHNFKQLYDSVSNAYDAW